MALINSLLVSLLAYFGVVVGLFIATMTKLEVRQGHVLSLTTVVSELLLFLWVLELLEFHFFIKFKY